MRYRRSILCGVSLLATVGIARAADDGGMRDFFQPSFREMRAPAPAPSFSSDPLSVQVRPSRPRTTYSRPVRSESGRDVLAAQKEAYARLNPSKNPNWYLEDPTLRRGDIVVLERKALVFEGEKSSLHMQSDFRPANQAGGLAADERKQLNSLAAL